MSDDAYHLEELKIARDANDPRHAAPPIGAGRRRILDVGCGAGQTLIAAELGPGVLGVGVDPDRDALALGRSWGHGLRFARARGEALPFAAMSFDFLVARVALPYMHIRSALAECCRVLSPGGTVWMVLHPASMAWRELFRHLRRLQLKGALHRLYVLANGLLLNTLGLEIRFGRRGHESFQTRRGIARALRRAGFRGVAFPSGRAFVVTATRPDASEAG
ncbi:MAG: class I SAM-dependent methyltransferase [Planctomycetaceae bacterium]